MSTLESLWVRAFFFAFAIHKGRVMNKVGWILIAAGAVGAWAQDEFLLDEWDAVPEKLWALEAGSQRLSGESMDPIDALTLSRSLGTAWGSGEASLLPALAVVRIGQVEGDRYELQPSLTARFDGVRWAVGLSGWLGQDLQSDSLSLGGRLEMEMHGEPWNGAWLWAGPQMVYDDVDGSVPGLFAGLRQSWNWRMGWHGPALNSVLEFTPAVPSGRGQGKATAYELANTWASLTYRWGWFSDSGALGLIAESGYGMDLMDLGGPDEGIRASLTAGWYW